MKNHKMRNLLILVVIVVALINIYPTLGWMVRSRTPELNQEIQQKIDDEKSTKGTASFARSIKHWAMCDRDQVINLGLDLQGGIQMVISVRITDKIYEDIKDKYPSNWSRSEIQYSVQQDALMCIRRRINDFEAKEPIIQALGKDKIQVQLPGEKDIARAKGLIIRTAYLTFHIVGGQQETIDTLRAVDRHFENAFIPYLETPSEGYFEVKPDNLKRVMKMASDAKAVEGLLPQGKMVAFSQPPNSWEINQNYKIYLMNEKAGTDGAGLSNAYSRPDDERPGSYQIVFEFQGAGAESFAKLTEDNINNLMAIVVDGKVCSAATIQERIYGGGRITGSFSGEQARDLAIALSSGSMPVPVKEEYSAVVGASLGADLVNKGVWSTIIGLILVVIFMLIYYRFAGLIANVALVLNALLVMAALAYFGATLTLPGIAGLILTIGMAVDANVLIFERIREEIRNGRSLVAAIDSGYAKATVTILDANVTTLIAAAVLWQFGTGPIEGFATTLSIGVCSSVFTALIVTRAIFDFLAEKKALSKLPMNSFIKAETKIQFLAKRKFAFTLSAVVIIAGMALFFPRALSGDMFGVDFSEGTSMTVAFNNTEAIDVGDVRQKLTDAGFDTPTVQEYGAAGNQFTIRLGDSSVSSDTESVASTSAISQRVQTALAPLSRGIADNVEILQEETVGPAVGKQLRTDALAAIFYALLFIVAYLWFRFELKFALGAVAALAHDVLVTIGLFALFGREISMPVVAALLTIIGYSLNDTIVVFDRIREDLKLYRGRGLSYIDIMNLSINQTLSRTLLTSITTLLVIVVLCLFGGSVIFDFALALLIGVVVGTYSSIFVASPVVYAWQNFVAKRREAKGPGRADKKRGKKAKASA